MFAAVLFGWGCSVYGFRSVTTLALAGHFSGCCIRYNIRIWHVIGVWLGIDCKRKKKKKKKKKVMEWKQLLSILMERLLFVYCSCFLPVMSKFMFD